MAKVIIDPEFKSLIPSLSEAEYAQLEANILRDGCRDPLVTWQGILLDGHNRHTICTDNGLLFETAAVSLDSRDDAKAWIIRNQFGRRNLPLYVRAELALLLEPLVAAKAKENQRAGGGSGDSGRQNSAQPTKTRDEVAKAAGTSHDTIAKTRYLRDNADDETKERLRTGETSVNKEYTKTKRAAQMAENETKGIVPTPQGQYDVVVMDPPWPMDKIMRDCRPNQAAMDYPTMTEGELEDLEIPSANNCHVFVWTTQRFLPMTLRLMTKWGFRYVLTMVWHKPGGFQPIGLPQYNCEFCVYARKGTPKFIDTKAFPVCFSAPRGKHSEKPIEFYETIARVTKGRRIDMFSRRKIENFTPWGNES